MSLSPLLNLALLLYLFVVLAAATLWFALTVRRGRREQSERLSANQPPRKQASKTRASGRDKSKVAAKAARASQLNTHMHTQLHPAARASKPVTRATAKPHNPQPQNLVHQPVSKPDKHADVRAAEFLPERDISSREAKRAMMKARANLRNRPRPQDMTEPLAEPKPEPKPEPITPVTSPATQAPDIKAPDVKAPDVKASTPSPATSQTALDTSTSNASSSTPSTASKKRQVTPVRADKLIPTVHTPAAPRNALRPAPKDNSPHPSPHAPLSRVIPLSPTVKDEAKNEAAAEATEDDTDAFGAFGAWLDKDRDRF